MALSDKIKVLWQQAKLKRRLKIEDIESGEERWYMHISAAGILSAAVAFVLIIFFGMLILVAYTPILELLPGYRTEATRSRENLVANIMRLDSMERVVNSMLTYNENVTMILEGRSPVARTYQTDDSTRLDKSLVMPNSADSALRAQMEGDGPYSLGQTSSRRSVREAIEMVTPVNGLITQRFDLKEQVYGVKIATSSEADVAAIDDGTIISSIWTPDAGYVVTIQHSGNLISISRNMLRSNVSAGQRVKSGFLIGATTTNDREESRPFEFQLWNDGKAVDPEAYIVF